MLNSIATSCYRYILQIKKIDKIKNSYILEQVKKLHLIKSVQERRLRFIGKCARATNNPITKKYILYIPNMDEEREVNQN
jgi:hypothetical protein